MSSTFSFTSLGAPRPLVRFAALCTRLLLACLLLFCVALCGSRQAQASAPGWASNFVAPGTNGTVRAIAETSDAIYSASNFTVTSAPAVVTLAADTITATGATLYATINPGNLVTTAQFQYGLTSSYGTNRTITLSPNNGGTDQSVSVALTGLNGNRTYHFHATATNSLGTTDGGDLTFTTPNRAPVVKDLDLPTRIGSSLLARLELSDPDNDDLTVTTHDNVGTLSDFDSSGFFLYTPPATGAAFEDSFTVEVSDGIDTTTANITMHVASYSADTPFYSAVGASDVQGYGASDYGGGTYAGSYPKTSFSPAKAYAPLVASSGKLGATLPGLALSRRAINSLTLTDAFRSVGGTTNIDLAAGDGAKAYSVAYGPNDVLFELLPLLLTPPTNANSSITLNGIVTGYLSTWKPAYTNVKATILTANPDAKFAAITVPDLGPSLTARFGTGLTPTQKLNLSVALSSACSQMTTHIKTTFPSAVDVQTSSDLSAPAGADSALVFNPATDLFLDGFHPNDSGYAKLATRLFRLLDVQFNHAPTGIALSNASVAENSAAVSTVGTFSSTDQDAGDTFTYTLVAGTGDDDNSSFTIDGATLQTAASFNYESKHSYSILVRSTDAGGASFDKSFTISVTNVNEAPVITSDGGDTSASLSVAENSTAVTTVTATDVDSANLTYSLGGGADAAFFAIDATSGVLTFQLAPDFESPADANTNNVYEVTVQVSDDGTAVASDTQDLSITVTNVNEAPTAVDDEYTVPFLIGATVAAPGVLSNDTDPENDTCTVVDGDITNAAGTLDPVSGPAHGTLTLNTDGSFTYTPSLAFVGDDSFSYKISDGSLESNVATVTIHVSANTAPVAVNDSSSTLEDHFVDIDVLSNDTDVESANADLAVDPTSIAGETGGTAVLRPDHRTIRFTPAANANGSAFSFTYKVTDGTDSSATSATVSITVTAVNDVPSFTKGADQSLNEGAVAQSISGWATNISAGPADEAGQSLDFIVSNDNNALFSVQPAIDSSGTLTYTLQSGVLGSATVTVQLHDDGGTADSGANTSDAQTFTITVSDGTAPGVTISTPTSNQKLPISSFGSNSFKGSATDNIGVTQVKLQLSRKRDTTTTYWNGTAFDTTRTTVTAHVAADGHGGFSWALDSNFPVAADLDLGSYTLYAIAYDAAGNSHASTGRIFTVIPVDTEKPVVTVGTPTANQKVLISQFVAGFINGSATDNIGAVSAKVRLYRKRPGGTEFWNGTAFQPTSVYAVAALSGHNWQLDDVPSAGQLDSGVYTVVAYATDAAGNTGASAARSFTLGTDFTAPSINIDNPKASVKINVSNFNNTTIRGNAADNIGVTSVKVRLVRKRSTGIEYWGGHGFGLTPALVDATVTTVGDVIVNWVLDQAPAASDLDNGVYTITAYAYDAVGNAKTSVGRSFTIYGVPTVTSAEEMSINSASEAPAPSAGGS